MADLQVIQDKIYEIRGQRVMLDRDLAEMYGVTTSALNQSVGVMLNVFRKNLCSAFPKQNGKICHHNL